MKKANLADTYRVRWTKRHIISLGLSLTYEQAAAEWGAIISGEAAPSPAFCAAVDWHSLGTPASDWLRLNRHWVRTQFVPYVRALCGQLLEKPLSTPQLVACERYGETWRSQGGGQVELLAEEDGTGSRGTGRVGKS